MISAAPSPQQAHNPQEAESAIYRRSGGSPWQEIHNGLPPARGLLASVLATNEAEPGVFYTANNQGVFRSTDTGFNWEAPALPRPGNITPGRANALVIVPE